MIQLFAQISGDQNTYGEVVEATSLVYDGAAQVDDKGLVSEHLAGSALQDKELIHAYLPTDGFPAAAQDGRYAHLARAGVHNL